MSFGANKSHSENKNQSTSSSSLSPDVLAVLNKNYGAASDLAKNSTYNPLSAGQIQGYENPYTQDVIDTTNADLTRQNKSANIANDQSATAQGAFGGTRSAVQDALTNEAYARQAAQTDASLRAANYAQATNTGQIENTAQNQYPLLLQQLLNAAAGNFGDPTLSKSQSTGSGKSNSFGFNIGVGGGAPGPGGGTGSSGFDGG